STERAGIEPAGTDAVHPFTRLLTSGDPRPEAASYPTPALNPKEPFARSGDADDFIVASGDIVKCGWIGRRRRVQTGIDVPEARVPNRSVLQQILIQQGDDARERRRTSGGATHDVLPAARDHDVKIGRA